MYVKGELLDELQEAIESGLHRWRERLAIHPTADELEETETPRDVDGCPTLGAHPHTEIRSGYDHGFNPFASRSIARVIRTSGPSRNSAR
ncbi:hypothetical protein [Microbacterium alcoholitolerans]|uniref:hypothetical protein n=1 Tax=unclassified Microbacterium TaxID=2609290 RepID=UPI003D180F31